MSHFISKSCAGERCRCGADATHKLGEEIADDEPCSECGMTWKSDPWEWALLDRSNPRWCYVSYHALGVTRHGLTAYVCCACFTRVLGPATGCPMMVMS